MRFARRVFRIAGISGLAFVLPQYFLEQRYGHDHPPAITHPEHYYGFLGVCLAWQVAFLVIATDPARYRPLMLAALLEKLAFGLATVLLVLYGRSPSVVLLFGCIDLVFGALFLAAYRLTSPADRSTAGSAGPNPVGP